jgi:arylsulfatase A-like enzyme
MQKSSVINRRGFLKLAGFGAACAFAGKSVAEIVDSPAAGAGKPNVVVILADDIGYGDFGCYGATVVKTPNIDKLAAQGVRFTDAHSSAATCTPTRYSLMTGQYAWRKSGTGILSGVAKLCIDTDRLTLPAMMKRAGYATGCVGKWHLGLGDGNIDYNAEIKPGPLDVGFDYCYIIPATGDRVPCVYVENRRVVNLDPADPIQVSYGKKVGNEPTGRENPELLKMKAINGHDGTIINGIGRIGFMAGGKAARWVDVDIADTITAKAVQYIEKSKDKPFFLYFATHDIHAPRVPHDRFKEASQCGLRGDAIQEFDWSVGQIVDTLERLGLAENTLLIVTSDNGPVVEDGYGDGSAAKLNGHTPAGPLRGGKYSYYEGGTREPFVVRWPKRVKPGTSDALVCQIDLLASLATLTGQKLPDAAGPDSMDVLPALLGEAKEGRDSLVEQGPGQAIRKSNWKYIPPRGAGTGKKAKAAGNVPAGETAAAAMGELYDLSTDLGETKNIAAEKAEKVKELADLLRKIQETGRSR